MTKLRALFLLSFLLLTIIGNGKDVHASKSGPVTECRFSVESNNTFSSIFRFFSLPYQHDFLCEDLGHAGPTFKNQNKNGTSGDGTHYSQIHPQLSTPLISNTPIIHFAGNGLFLLYRKILI